jgi:hypothetical protein
MTGLHLGHRPRTLSPCLLIDYALAFGLGHTSSPSRPKDDDPVVPITQHVYKPPCTLRRALSSTLSSNHIAQIHLMNICLLVQHDFVILLIA